MPSELKVSDVLIADPDRADPPVALAKLGAQTAFSLVHDKVHIFVLDKLTAKQIRDSDVKQYFGQHGASSSSCITTLPDSWAV